MKPTTDYRIPTADYCPSPMSITVSDLRAIEAFEGLTDEALVWLADHFEEVWLEPDDILTPFGKPAEWMFATFEGFIRAVMRDSAGREGNVFAFEPGDVTGMLPHSRMTTWPADARAMVRTRIGRLHVSHFPEMLQRFPEIEERLTHVLIDRTRNTARMQLQQEKLASLGTMAAGLAHELNNPASAARRAAQSLRNTLRSFDSHATAMLARVMFREPPAGDEDPFQPIYDIARGPQPKLDALERGAREDELADWLEEMGVPEPWDAAADLVTVGFTRQTLEEFSQRIVPEHVRHYLSWTASEVAMRLLAEELVESTLRISDLVAAMKSYSFMDQANEKQLVDIHQGIESTLTILGYKLKHRSLEIVREFEEIPPVPALGGELNQVWTNLLDNAIAAVPDEGGRITIRTCFDEAADRVEVNILDNGPGIPPELQDRIFDPFFTTKGVGEGTGLGLDIVYRIVTTRHGGTVYCSSMPGETLFRVRLPVKGSGGAFSSSDTETSSD